MAVQSYLVFPEPGTGAQVRQQLDAIRGCETALADDGRVILLVADSASGEDEDRIRADVDAIEEVQCTVLTFGEIDPDTDVPDPLAAMKRESRASSAGLPLPTLNHVVAR